MNTIKTILHAYNFNIRDPNEKIAYEQMCQRIKATGVRKMEAFSAEGISHWFSKIAPLNDQTIELETTYLFDNQWNTAPIEGISETGLRVFDWYEHYEPETSLRRQRKIGHWLEQTAEMKAIRDNTMKCGYCGKQEPAAKGYVFCPHCIDSEYLTEKDLPLTRMVCVTDTGKPRAELTEAEKAHLLPLFTEARIRGVTDRGKMRIAKARDDVHKKRQRKIQNANIEADGFLWLMDRGLRTDNVIFYEHRGRFMFGWRQKYGEAELAKLLEVISEFEFPYDIECADGRKLSGE